MFNESDSSGFLKDQFKKEEWLLTLTFSKKYINIYMDTHFCCFLCASCKDLYQSNRSLYHSGVSTWSQTCLAHLSTVGNLDTASKGRAPSIRWKLSFQLPGQKMYWILHIAS